MNNSTTIPVAIAVNGVVVRTIDPKSQVTLARSELPSLPWSVETRTSRGRVLSTLTVRAGDVVSGDGFMRGDGVRTDLSCGRLDVWAGSPIDGPANGSGVPGDCDP